MSAPDTAALRRDHYDYDSDGHCDDCGERHPCTVRALCDAADEVERLTSKYEEWESMHSSCIALREDVARHEREAERLREEVRRMARDLAEYRQSSDGGTVMRCVNCSSPTCDGEACMDGPYQRDAARTAHADLVADLRALHAPRTQVMSGSSDPKHVPMTRQVCSFCGDNYGNAPYPCATAALLDRHAPGGTALFYVDDVTGEPCPTRGTVLCTVPWSANGTHRHHDGRLDRHAPEEGR